MEVERLGRSASSLLAASLCCACPAQTCPACSSVSCHSNRMLALRGKCMLHVVSIPQLRDKLSP